MPKIRENTNVHQINLLHYSNQPRTFMVQIKQALNPVK